MRWSGPNSSSYAPQLLFNSTNQPALSGNSVQQMNLLRLLTFNDDCGSSELYESTNMGVNDAIGGVVFEPKNFKATVGVDPIGDHFRQVAISPLLQGSSTISGSVRVEQTCQPPYGSNVPVHS